MDAAAYVSLGAALISVISFALTYRLTKRQVDAVHQQVAIGQHEIDTAALIELMKTFGQPAFQRRYNYVTYRLQDDYPPEQAIPLFDIKGDDGDAAVEVAYFFQNCAAFADYKLVTEDKIMTFLHLRFSDVWNAVKPYVEAERERIGFRMLSSLEEYAKHAETLTDDDVHQPLLRTRGVPEK